MARPGPRRQRECPLRGAKWPLLAAVAATCALVMSSLFLQHHGLLNMGEDTLGNDSPSPPPRYTLLTPAPRATPTPPAPRPTPEGELVEVVRVVDGDTTRVRLDGKELTLRLIGLDTPETVHPTQPVGCYGPEATAEAKRMLPAGSQVRLIYDPTQGRTDYYGRTLGYLDLPGGLDYAEHMIATGHATEYRYRKDYQRMATYRAQESAARQAGRGLWGACPPVG